MARRDHRVGLATTTISVKLTAPELEALDDERKHSEGLFNSSRTGRPYRSFHEGRGDALRRLINEAHERRVEEVKRRDPRQVTLTEAIEAASAETSKTASSPATAAPAGKTRSAGSRRSVRPAGETARAGSKARIRR
jgi:hypothetical protein